MTSDNLRIWNDVKQAPNQFLKRIDFGYLKGKSDINPQWRLMAMTQAFGPVGHGWTYRINRLWSESSPDGQLMAFAEVSVKTKLNGDWGEEFSGIGGSMIAELSKGNIKPNDEGYKMAVTDALSVAFKAVGIAADIYLGNYDGSKYVKNLDAAYINPEDAKFEKAKIALLACNDIARLDVAVNAYKDTKYSSEVNSIVKQRKSQLEGEFK